MIFAAGITKCEKCDRPLDSTDDYIPVMIEQESSGLPVPGFYHAECFDSLPEKKAYLRYFTEKTDAFLTERESIWNILEKGDVYAMAYVPFTDSVFLYFLTKGRTILLSCKGPYAEFCDFLLEELSTIKQLEVDNPMTSASGWFSVAGDRNGGGVVLGIRNGVNKLIRIAVKDGRRLTSVNPDWKTPSKYVDFSKLCPDSAVTPREVDGFLDNCRGIVTSVEVKKDIFTVRLVAEQWSRIHLTQSELADLIKLLRRVS
jgi:hypothetical protein